MPNINIICRKGSSLSRVDSNTLSGLSKVIDAYKKYVLEADVEGDMYSIIAERTGETRAFVKTVLFSQIYGGIVQ
jgi:hypothetical protein